MKKTLFNFIAILAVSAITASATILITSPGEHAHSNISDVAVGDTPFLQNSVTDARFASTVVSTEYPDLTYAAENAVKAVVNIEATLSVGSRSMPRDPFFEFFG